MPDNIEGNVVVVKGKNYQYKIFEFHIKVK